MTLNDHFTLNSVIAQVRLEFFCVDFFENNCVKIIKVDHTLSSKKCSAWTLVSGGIRFMRIFAGVLKFLCKFSLDPTYACKAVTTYAHLVILQITVQKWLYYDMGIPD